MLCVGASLKFEVASKRKRCQFEVRRWKNPTLFPRALKIEQNTIKVASPFIV
jgi:hypothetical protein